jgi:hypothetical protein
MKRAAALLVVLEACGGNPAKQRSSTSDTAASGSALSPPSALRERPARLTTTERSFVDVLLRAPE